MKLGLVLGCSDSWVGLLRIHYYQNQVWCSAQRTHSASGCSIDKLQCLVYSWLIVWHQQLGFLSLRPGHEWVMARGGDFLVAKGRPACMSGSFCWQLPSLMECIETFVVSDSRQYRCFIPSPRCCHFNTKERLEPQKLHHWRGQPLVTGLHTHKYQPKAKF